MKRGVDVVEFQQFKEALKAAGLANPGRTTWSGVAEDGLAVFTIWEHETYEVEGRTFATWRHEVPLSAGRLGSARAFVRRALKNIDAPCRAVIVYGKSGVERAEYPHPRMSRVQFRFVDVDALLFSAELLPPA